MSDYIERQAVIDTVAFGITTAKAINIDTGESRELFANENEELRRAIKRIHDLPSADVVLVCRCKDCIHHAYDEIFSCYWCEHPGMAGEVKFDFYCAYGEREE